MSDLISRQAAIDADGLDEEIRCEMCKNPMHTDRGCDGNCEYDEKLYEKIMQILNERIKALPSAQTEWIPVAERMPEDEGQYLVYGDFPDNGYLIAYAKRILNWKKTNFFIAPFWNSPSEVIHAQAWCKLPSPYRAERSKQ